jgi:hypothetical protein
MAGLSFPAVYLAFVLVPAVATIGIHVVADTGTPGGNGALEHANDPLRQGIRLPSGHPGRASARAYAGQEQSLIGVDISHSSEHRLIEEHGLDGSPTPSSGGKEGRTVDAEGVGAQSFQSGVVPTWGQ